MLDSKIDELIKAHLNDYNISIEKQQTALLLGDDFTQQLAEKYDEEELENIINEAKQIMTSYLGGSELILAKTQNRSQVINYRQALLQSFLLRPKLNILMRKLYIDVYVQSMQQSSETLFYNPEEEITNKILLWFESFKETEHGFEKAEAFEIARLAVTDQVYNNVFNDDVKKKIPKK